jgi:hypothetical protein
MQRRSYLHPLCAMCARKFAEQMQRNCREIADKLLSACAYVNLYGCFTLWIRPVASAYARFSASFVRYVCAQVCRANAEELQRNCRQTFIRMHARFSASFVRYVCAQVCRANAEELQRNCRQTFIRMHVRQPLRLFHIVDLTGCFGLRTTIPLGIAYWRPSLSVVLVLSSSNCGSSSLRFWLVVV